MSESYPFFNLARRYHVPYARVLQLCDEMERLNVLEYWAGFNWENISESAFSDAILRYLVARIALAERTRRMEQ